MKVKLYAVDVNSGVEVNGNKDWFNEHFHILKINEFEKEDKNMELRGYVVESNKVYERITYVFPVARHYETDSNTPYIKYSCPICDALGNTHSEPRGVSNCSLCGVNFSWKDAEQ